MAKIIIRLPREKIYFLVISAFGGNFRYVSGSDMDINRHIEFNNISHPTSIYDYSRYNP